MIPAGHPRPTLARERFESLNGVWEFEFDREDIGLREKWYKGRPFSHKIKVPFVYQCPESGIGSSEIVEVVWYRRAFTVSLDRAKRIILNFGAVDYHAMVWVNGELAGEHRGGFTSFGFDITRLLRDGENELCVRVHDPHERLVIRGKQYCSDKIDRCFYEASTGIWQDVWLEEAGDVYIRSLLVTPSIKNRNIKLEVKLNKFAEGAAIDFEIGFNGKIVRRLSSGLDGRISNVYISIYEPDFVDEKHYWSLENPNLFELKATVSASGRQDTVYTYFGMREIEVYNGRVLLNNSPLYQRLILNQGYYPGRLYTGTDEDFIRDIELIKSYGFNGLRMHQKIEHPRFYYLCAKMGLLVWGELPSAYHFSSELVAEAAAQMSEFIVRDYNCPAIVVWVPLNESWGVRNIRYDRAQINFAKGLCGLIKGLDPTRLVSGNDGWEVAGGDLVAVHNYFRGGESFTEALSDMDNYERFTVNNYRMTLAEGEKVDGRPIILSEYGGISFETEKGWGYAGAVKTEEEFIDRLSDVQRRIYGMRHIQGFCYTQFTDVFQETNGLVDMDRNVKLPIEKIKPIIKGEI